MSGIILILTTGLIIGNLIAVYSFRKMDEEYYIVLTSLIGNVKDKYPEITEEEWVELLNDDTEYIAGKLLLEQYGIFQNDSVMIRQQKRQRGLIFWINLIFIVIGLGIIGTCLLYYRNRVRNMERLAAYIRRVEQGEYSLHMLENNEDELSSLKNELYKVTVMLREAAQQSQSQKRALADSVSDISHQIKTPLTSAMILLDNLSESEKMDEATRKKFLAEITRQLSHINWLVATMLKLSRLDAGVVEFTIQPFCLNELIEEVIEKMELMAEWKQITLVREGDSNIYMTGDSQWIGEAVVNVVKNAVEHSKEGSRIIVKTRNNAVYTSICVKDFGEGMDEEEQKHIFERFYRSKASARDSVGIGLSLAKEIIEHQNGYVTVSSQKGEGTEFLIRFLKV